MKGSNKLTVLTKTVIICNECNYEYPNDYYGGIRDWIIATNSGGYEYHFCSKDCFEYYVKEDIKLSLTISKVLNNCEDEFIKLLNK